MIEKDYDVIVVGAGLAGLCAAHQLSLAGKKVLVLESSARIGGRIYNERLANTSIDLGGNVFNSEHTALLQLLSSHEVKPLSVKVKSGQKRPKISGFLTKLNLSRVNRQLKVDTSQLNVHQPWLGEQAFTLDRMSFLDYLIRLQWFGKKHDGIKSIFDQLLGYDIACISALDAMFQIKVQKLWNGDGSDLKTFLLPSGSLHRLLKRLSLEVDVRLQHPVHTIERRQRAVEVSGAFFRLVAGHIIMAIPMHSLNSIKFRPALSKSTYSLWDQSFSSKDLRFSMAFEQRFWPKLEDPFLLKHSASISLLTGHSDEENRSFLSGQISGHEAEEIAKYSTKDRQDAIESKCQVALGRKIPRHLGMATKYWDDDFWSSSRAVFRGLGCWTTYQDLALRPVGRIHWAGAETYLPFYGTMEGAVRSASRASEEILSKSSMYHAI